MINIKPYNKSDFKEIASWWKESTGQSPLEDMLVEDGTFILEIDNVPALCLTVLLTQSRHMAYLFSFIKNPIFKENLEEYGQQLWNYCFEYAKSKGYSRVLCFSDNKKLSEKYIRFGMSKTADVSAFLRIL